MLAEIFRRQAGWGVWNNYAITRKRGQVLSNCLKYYSAALSQWSSTATMKACNNTSMGGAQKTFGDGSTYYAWYMTTKLGLDTTKVGIIINQ